MNNRTIYPILYAVSLVHFINDTIQAIIASSYPLFKENFNLNFSQIGIVAFSYQLTASIFQPFIGLYTDKNPKPYSIVIALIASMLGIVFLSIAKEYYFLIIAVCLIGLGSSIFHPESSRIAYLSSGGRRGFAQSIFQTGGNTGSALGPLLVALIVAPYGQNYILWFGVISIVGIIFATKIGKWYSENVVIKAVAHQSTFHPSLSKNRAIFSLIILMLLIFSKFVYIAGVTNYYTFYLIEKFHLSIQDAQIRLFIFSTAVAIGTIAGGALSDKFGRKLIIWLSILGVAPFTLLLPHANLFWTSFLSAVIGLIIASAFSAIVVFAQEIVPGRVGLIAGIFFGLMFGIGGIGSAILGKLADYSGIIYVFNFIAFLPLIGIITGLLPNLKSTKSL